MIGVVSLSGSIRLVMTVAGVVRDAGEYGNERLLVLGWAPEASTSNPKAGPKQ